MLNFPICTDFGDRTPNITESKFPTRCLRCASAKPFTSADMPLESPQHEVADGDRAIAESLLRRIAEECPCRAPGSRDEHRAQVILSSQLRRLGGIASWQRFRFSGSLYLVLGMHFTLAVAASLLFFVHPIAAAVAHLVLAVSYVADSNRIAYLLRRLLPKVTASNLLVTFPAQAEVRRRIVISAHADAAPTGWMFQQSGFAWTDKTPKILRQLGRPLLIAVIGLCVVAAVEFNAWASGSYFPNFPGAFYGFTIYFAVLATLNLQVWWKNEIVPGANDNLSACAALPVLAKRLTAVQPDDVELVFVVTACEEAGTGGALQLAKQMRGEWKSDETDILVLDSIAGGELCLFQEGEMIPWRIPNHLQDAVLEVANREDQTEKLVLFPLPAGATDAISFLSQGYSAVCLGRIDRHLGTPRNYHLPSDTPDNIDYDELMGAIDFSEQLVRNLASVPSEAKAHSNRQRV